MVSISGVFPEKILKLEVDCIATDMTVVIFTPAGLLVPGYSLARESQRFTTALSKMLT